MAEVVSNSARSREGFAWNPEDGFTYGRPSPSPENTLRFPRINTDLCGLQVFGLQRWSHQHQRTRYPHIMT